MSQKIQKAKKLFTAQLNDISLGLRILKDMSEEIEELERKVLPEEERYIY